MANYGGYARTSVSPPVPENDQYGFQDDMQIEAQRPVAQVIEIVVDARLHLVQGAGLAAIAVDLGPAGDAGLDLVADHIAFYQVAIDFIVRHGMGPGADDTHAALQHIDELGQFIE